MTIKFHSEARKEFIEAAEYYEEQVVGLGDEFLDEVEKVLDVIEQQPATGGESHEYRKKVFGFTFSLWNHLCC